MFMNARTAAVAAAAVLIGVCLVRADDKRVRISQLGGNELVEDPKVWRAFRPLVKGAGEGDADRAVGYLRKGSEIARKADENLKLDEPIERFREQALESLEDFDFEGFYELLPERRGRYRRFTYEGFPVKDGYRVRRPHSKQFEVTARGTRRGFGDTSGVIRVRQSGDEDSDRFLVQWRGGLGLGDLKWSSILDGVSDALGVLETAWDGGEVPLVMQAADAGLKKSQPGLGREDRRVLASAWASYPQVAAHLVSISATDDVVASKKVKGCTHMTARSRWDLERMARHYPEVASYFKRFKDLAKIHLRLRDAAGRQLLSLKLDSERMQSELSLFIKDGALIPSKRGKPLTSSPARYERMTAHVDMHFVLHGIHLYVDDFRVRLRYAERPSGATFHATATEVPKVRASGAAFGFIPTRMVNWFIPGDIEGLATRFYENLVKGNEGRGLAAITHFERPESNGKATVHGTAGAEILDSGLVRFAMRVVSDRVLPDDDEEEDLRRLALAYRKAFDADLARFAQFGRPVVADAWAETRDVQAPADEHTTTETATP